MAFAICPHVWLERRLPADGTQMRLVDFYSLQETLDSIRPQRQQTKLKPSARTTMLHSLTFSRSGNYTSLYSVSKLSLYCFFTIHHAELSVFKSKSVAGLSCFIQLSTILSLNKLVYEVNSATT